MNKTEAVQAATPRISVAVHGGRTRRPGAGRPLIGVLRGEGVGPEVIDGALRVLDAVAGCTGQRFELRYGGKIGVSAERETGKVLPPDIVDFCQTTFDEGGAVFCGPGGSRFVYELRACFDLFCKLIPIVPNVSLRGAGRFRPEAVEGVDIMVVRENAGGIYFGDYGEQTIEGGVRAYHHFHYDSPQVERIIRVAVSIAAQRRGRLCVVHKPAGLPTISRMWSQCAERLAAESKVTLEKLEVDTANYRMLADAASFDVVVAPNLFGDVLSDGAAALLASRGMSYSANYAADGVSVYQTAHGAAYDLAGRDVANPLGQIHSLAMMLHETFALPEAAAAVRWAIDQVLSDGWRTADIAENGCRVVGTAELSRQVAERVPGYFARQPRTGAAAVAQSR